MALCLPLSQGWLERSTSSQTSPSQRLLAFPPLNFDLGFWEHWLLLWTVLRWWKLFQPLPALNRTTELVQMQKKENSPPSAYNVKTSHLELCHCSFQVFTLSVFFFFIWFFFCFYPLHWLMFSLQRLRIQLKWGLCAACLYSDCIALLQLCSSLSCVFQPSLSMHGDGWNELVYIFSQIIDICNVS